MAAEPIDDAQTNDVREPIPLRAAGGGNDGGVTAVKRSSIEQDGLGFRWETGRKGIVFTADRISPHFGPFDLQAEIRVLVNGRHVHMSNYVITKPKERDQLAEMLAHSPALVHWDLMDLNGWRDLVEQFFTGVQMKQRSRIELNHTHMRPKTRMQYLVDYLVLKTGRPNLLFAPGGSGKSFLMAAICVAMKSRRGIGELTIAEANPVYFDWEDDFDVFEDRINCVTRGFGLDESPEVSHARMRGGTVADQINEMAKIIQTEGATVGIIDSMSAAAGTTGTGGGWDSVSQRVFDSLGLIPDVTWIIIGHVGKNFLKEPSGSMFGSIQSMNRASNAWEIRTEQEPGSKSVHLKLYDAKWNHRGKAPVLGLRMDFYDDQVRFASESSDTIPDNVADKMVAELMGGQILSIKDLATRIGVQESSIRTAKFRFKERFAEQKKGVLALNREWDGSDELAPESTEKTTSEAPEESLPW